MCYAAMSKPQPSPSGRLRGWGRGCSLPCHQPRLTANKHKTRGAMRRGVECKQGKNNDGLISMAVATTTTTTTTTTTITVGECLLLLVLTDADACRERSLCRRLRAAPQSERMSNTAARDHRLRVYSSVKGCSQQRRGGSASENGQDAEGSGTPCS
jgi:hypothetical protein